MAIVYIPDKWAETVIPEIKKTGTNLKDYVQESFKEKVKKDFGIELE